MGTLINNAGLFQPFPDYLEEMPEQRIRNMVTVNALVPTLVRCALAALLHEPRCRRRRRRHTGHARGMAGAQRMNIWPRLCPRSCARWCCRA